MSANTEKFAKSVRTGIKALWWIYLVRGILAMIFGLTALVVPGQVAEVLAFIIGIYLFVDGIVLSMGANSERKSNPRWGWNMTRGVVTALAGLFVMILPSWAAGLVGLIVVWTMIIGAILAATYGISAASNMKRRGEGWKWGLISNVITLILAIAFAVIVIFDPEFAVKALVWVAGFWALIAGFILVFIAFAVRKSVNTLGDQVADAIRRSE